MRSHPKTLAALALLASAAAMAACTVIPEGQGPRPRAEHHQQPPPPPSPPPPPRDYPPVQEPPRGPSDASLTYAQIGQTVHVDGPSITPLRVLEDSRCPMNARCVWAGQVRLSIRIARGETLEITSGKPVHVADGTLELVDVRPDKMAGANNGAVKTDAYRFGFRFQGGR